MSDYSSELPIRSQYPAQVLPDDVIVKIGDGTNPTTQFAAVDTHGSLSSIIKDTSGNAIADQLLSTTYWLQVVGPSNGSSAPGTAASFATLIAGEYSSSLPALTTGQQSAIQIDSSGRILVSSIANPLPSGTNTIGAVTQANGPWTQNLTQVGGSAISLGQAAMAASIPVAIASNQSAIPVTQSTSPWVTSDLADGAVTPGTAGTKSLLGGLVYESAGITLTNGQQAALQGDAAGNLRVNLETSIPAGTNNIGKMEITDGTNVVGVAPASTAAFATQPAAVVALSPNTPLPAGANNIGATNANLYVSSAPVTVANPVPVTITSASSGTPIQNFTTLTAIAAGSNATATYTVPATHTFSFERVFISAENRIKVVIANNATTIFTAFNSSANPNIDVVVTAPPTVPAGNAITVQVFNIDAGASNAYVTIEGNQIT